MSVHQSRNSEQKLKLYSQPNFNGQRIHEREQSCRLSAGYFEEDRNAQIHEGFRKVDHGLYLRDDRERLQDEKLQNVI